MPQLCSSLLFSSLLFSSLLFFTLLISPLLFSSLLFSSLLFSSLLFSSLLFSSFVLFCFIFLRFLESVQPIFTEFSENSLTLLNFVSGKEDNFQKYSLGVASTLGFPYDYESIMHYQRTAFSKNGLDTITPTDPNANIGQRDGLSAIDIAQLKAMYNCGTPTGNYFICFHARAELIYICEESLCCL